MTEAASAPPLVASGVSTAGAEAPYLRVSLAIGSGTFLASFAMNFWWPFLPLFLRELGASSDAQALFWVGLATAIQGVARLITGPFWGVLSDRYGRKLMLIRALFAASVTTVIAAAAHAPSIRYCIFVYNHVYAWHNLRSPRSGWRRVGVRAGKAARQGPCFRGEYPGGAGAESHSEASSR